MPFVEEMGGMGRMASQRDNDFRRAAAADPAAVRREHEARLRSLNDELKSELNKKIISKKVLDHMLDLANRLQVNNAVNTDQDGMMTSLNQIEQAYHQTPDMKTIPNEVQPNHIITSHYIKVQSYLIRLNDLGFDVSYQELFDAVDDYEDSIIVRRIYSPENEIFESLKKQHEKRLAKNAQQSVANQAPEGHPPIVVPSLFDRLFSVFSHPSPASNGVALIALRAQPAPNEEQPGAPAVELVQPTFNPMHKQ